MKELNEIKRTSLETKKVVEKRKGCGGKRRCRREKELDKTEKIEGAGKWRVAQDSSGHSLLSLAKRNQKYFHFDDTNKLI